MHAKWHLTIDRKIEKFVGISERCVEAGSVKSMQRVYCGEQ